MGQVGRGEEETVTGLVGWVMGEVEKKEEKRAEGGKETHFRGGSGSWRWVHWSR